MPLLELSGVSVAFGGPPVLDGVDLVLEPGERLALVGRNGSGKTTLLRVLFGDEQPDSGDLMRTSGIHMARLAQHVPEERRGTVLDLVASGFGSRPEAVITPHLARAAVSRLDLDPDAPLETLSAGLARRALLAAAIAGDPDLLLLDEPTNHLDIDSIAWLEEFLIRQRSTQVFVTHDRAFLRRVATGILDLDRGRLSRFLPDYDRYRERKEEGLESESRADTVADRRLAKEEAWIRQGVRERRKRNMGRVKRLIDLREDRSRRREAAGVVRMEAASSAPSGRLVARTKALSYAWGDCPVVRDLSTTILRGDRVGIVGPNGSGKTTLIRLLLGELAPDGGEVRLGTNLEVAYFDQLHSSLELDRSARDNVTDGAQMVTVNGRSRHVIGYLGEFLFPPEMIDNPVRTLSGGERNRLLLARLFARPSNLLVLDEPTNDLDVPTLEVLENLLSEYDGTMLLVSHDRELLDGVVTSLLVLGGDGRVREFVGGYSDWLVRREEERAARVASEAAAAPPREKPRPKPKSGLSFREQRELEALTARIEELEARQRSLHERMADPAFYQGGGEAIATAKRDLEAIDQEISAAYARWESLEDLKHR